MKEELQRSKNGGREPTVADIQVFNEVAWLGMAALGDDSKRMDLDHILELYPT